MMSYAVFYNNTDDNTLNELLVEFWDGASWNTIETINQNLGPNWVEFSTILAGFTITGDVRSEEQTSELQSRCLISYAVLCLKKKKQQKKKKTKKKVD